MSVLLVTSDAHDGLFRDGEPGAPALDAALAARGIESRWVLWDDPEVDWAGAELICVRATWDYQERPQEFLAWAARLDQSRLLNGADVFTWNHDKSYLAELADVDGLPVVPTIAALGLDELRAAIDATGRSVIKPAVGAGGYGLLIAEDSADRRLLPVSVRRQVVQPVVTSIETVGEVSVFVVGGEAVCQVRKRPAAGELRVHEHFGGVSQPVELEPAPVGVALDAWRWLESKFGRELHYLRVDLLWWGDRWCVSELEAIEPGLYLDVVPDNADPFADLVRDTLARRHAGD